MDRLFCDRQDAGKQLAAKLLHYKNNRDVVVLGIPRGGVIVAAEIAKALHAPLDVVIIKKIGVPHNEELALGAAGVEEYEIDTTLVDVYDVPTAYIEQQVQEKRKEAKKRYTFLQRRRSPRSLTHKIVIVVDDGIATGATMKLAVKIVNKEKPQELIVAVPVAAQQAIEDLHTVCDHVVSVKTLHDFVAISMFYEQFPQVEDTAVKELLSRYSEVVKDIKKS